MKKRVVFFHTTFNTPAYMKRLFAERYPDAELYNIVDDSILQEVRANDCQFTPNIVRKLAAYGVGAESIGACAIMSMCTTLAPAVKCAQASMEIPFFSVDTPMLHEAVRSGRRIALIVTAETTLLPSTLAAKQAAADEGIADVEIDTILVHGAFHAATVEQDQQKHDNLVMEAVKKAAKTHDLIVLAQVTMAGLKERLLDIPVPVLISPYSGLEQLAALLKCE